MSEKAVEGHSCSLCQHYQQGECVEATTGQEMESGRKRSLNCLTIYLQCSKLKHHMDCATKETRHTIHVHDHPRSPYRVIVIKIYLLQVLTCRLKHAKPHFPGLFFHSEFSKSVHVLHSAGVNVLVGSEYGYNAEQPIAIPIYTVLPYCVISPVMHVYHFMQSTYA